MNPSYAFKPYRSSIPSFLNSSNREDPSKSKLFIFQTIKPENPFSNFSQTPSRYLFPSAEEESIARNRDFARVWRVGPIASRGHSYALWQREMMDEAEWEGEREKLESGEGAPLERGRGEGRGTGRTGAYGVDPSGATANVSVSVSAGRASGPADIIQEVTSRTCPIIPLPPIHHVLLVVVLLHRAVATRSSDRVHVRRCSTCIAISSIAVASPIFVYRAKWDLPARSGFNV